MLEHSTSITGTNRVAPSGTVQVRSTSVEEIVRKKTGPCWPKPQRSPLSSVNGSTELGRLNVHCQNWACHWLRFCPPTVASGGSTVRAAGVASWATALSLPAASRTRSMHKAMEAKIERKVRRFMAVLPGVIHGRRKTATCMRRNDENRTYLPNLCRHPPSSIKYHLKWFRNITGAPPSHHASTHVVASTRSGLRFPAVCEFALNQGDTSWTWPDFRHSASTATER